PKNFKSLAELKEAEAKLVTDIASEGAVLLKNDAGTLPLAPNSKVSLFSASSVNFTYGGSGSGASSVELSTTLKEGLEKAGLKVNSKLWDFYASGKGKTYRRGEGSINFGRGEDWSINECSLRVLESEPGLLDSAKGTTPIFIMSRTGGEGMDLARNMSAYGGASDEHYLEPDQTELAILKYLNDNFEHVILIDNTNNAMELGWVKDYPHIDTLLHFAGSGRTGTIGLGEVLIGKKVDGTLFSPSGHLVDTYVYDNFSAPATQNFGDFKYEGGSNYYYVAYNEGIYVGYRYYETRYEDVQTNRPNAGAYNYQETVLYPFAYGLSYAEFAWSDYSTSFDSETGNITFSVKVTNSSTTYSGKEVVQFYGQSPYTAYDQENGIEKSAIELIGFKKSKILAPGESEIITCTANIESLKAYDSKTAKTYILDGGDYYFTAAKDAHDAINRVLAKKGFSTDAIADSSSVKHIEISSLDVTTYSVDARTGTKVTNQFDHATLDDVDYLTRSNWTMMDGGHLTYGTASDATWNSNRDGKRYTHALSPELKAKLDSKDSLNPNIEDEAALKKRVATDLKLIELRGKTSDDPLYDELVAGITYEEIGETIAHSGYGIPGVSHITMPDSEVLDGPAGLNILPDHDSKQFSDGSRTMSWPSELSLASTWNEELAEQMGDMIGEEAIWTKVGGWYAPGMNTHRTPFSGRNFEYYSEDPYLGGVMGEKETAAASKRGLICFIKHCALNDQETHRDTNGLITWANEQTIREIYLKPFEMTIKAEDSAVKYNERQSDGTYVMKEAILPTVKGLMTSYNRLGATWCGGNYNLITNVLRGEFGLRGMVLTDWDVNGYMDDKQMLLAGGDAKLDTIGKNEIVGSDAVASLYAEKAMKNIAYAVGNSLTMNGFIGKSGIAVGFANYKFILIGWGLIYLGAMVAMVFAVVKKAKKKEKGAE
ncbi:MAG: glycoside hydrolase family 3 C-terminal domain-containing protein, partial [Bacilli bacterium]|nr:glycoside hydrolase family 3 C-terminal domain-containing protein [Bacilli bacterium]